MKKNTTTLKTLHVGQMNWIKSITEFKFINRYNINSIYYISFLLLPTYPAPRIPANASPINPPYMPLLLSSPVFAGGISLFITVNPFVASPVISVLYPVTLFSSIV